MVATYVPPPGRCGLLGPGTILAHCVHLSTAEVELLRATGAGVSHCPNSNFTLKSGVCDVQRLKEAGVKVWIHSVIIASRLFISLRISQSIDVIHPSMCQTSKLRNSLPAGWPGD